MVGYETHFFFMEMETDLKELLEGYFEQSEYKIVETIYRGEKRTKVLEIFVDNRDGVRIDELARINKDLNELVDRKFAVNEISNIIISSPGADRPLKYIWQLYKHLGRKLAIQLNSAETIEGVLKEVVEDRNDSGKILIEIQKREGKKNTGIELREINFSEIKELKIKISFLKNNN